MYNNMLEVIERLLSRARPEIATGIGSEMVSPGVSTLEVVGIEPLKSRDERVITVIKATVGGACLSQRCLLVLRGVLVGGRKIVCAFGILSPISLTSCKFSACCQQRRSARPTRSWPPKICKCVTRNQNHPVASTCLAGIRRGARVSMGTEMIPRSLQSVS